MLCGADMFCLNLCVCACFRRVRAGCMSAWTAFWALEASMWTDITPKPVRGLICISPGLARHRYSITYGYVTWLEFVSSCRKMMSGVNEWYFFTLVQKEDDGSSGSDDPPKKKPTRLAIGKALFNVHQTMYMFYWIIFIWCTIFQGSREGLMSSRSSTRRRSRWFSSQNDWKWHQRILPPCQMLLRSGWVSL